MWQATCRLSRNSSSTFGLKENAMNAMQCMITSMLKKKTLLIEVLKVLAEEHKLEIRCVSPSKRYKEEDVPRSIPTSSANSSTQISTIQKIQRANTSSSHQGYIKMKLLTFTAFMLAGATAIQGNPQPTLIP